MRLCARCHQPIEFGVVWSLTEDQPPRKRSRMPLDPDTHPTDVAPNVAVHRRGATLWARVLDTTGYHLEYETLRTTHFATCTATRAASQPLPDNVIPLRRQLRLPGTRGSR